jgi:hypothetical protein
MVEMKGWDKINITITFFTYISINTTTPLFKEPTNAKVVEKTNIDIDPINANVNSC